MLIMNLATVAIMWFGSIQVADHGMPIGDLTAFITYIVQILLSVLMATFMLIMVPRAAASSERIQQVLHADISVNDPETPVVDAPVRGHVEFAMWSSATPAPRTLCSRTSPSRAARAR
jgi:ATP-binding cassette subfamily B multidrug efflux pump